MAAIDAVPVAIQRQLVELSKPNSSKNGEELLNEFSEILKKIEYSLRAGFMTGELLLAAQQNIESIDRPRAQASSAKEAPKTLPDDSEGSAEEGDLIDQLVSGNGAMEGASPEQGDEVASDQTIDQSVADENEEQIASDSTLQDLPVPSESSEQGDSAPTETQLGFAAAVVQNPKGELTEVAQLDPEAAPIETESGAGSELLGVKVSVENKGDSGAEDSDNAEVADLALPVEADAELPVDAKALPNSVPPRVAAAEVKNSAVTTKSAQSQVPVTTEDPAALAAQQAQSQGSAPTQVMRDVRVETLSKERPLIESFQRAFSNIELQIAPPPLSERILGAARESSAALNRPDLALNAADKARASALNQPQQNLTRGDTFLKNEEKIARQNEEKTARALPRSAQLRTLEKVEGVLKEAIKARDGKTISFRLDPPNLGSVKVDVSLRDGTLHARLVAESAQVAQFLRDKGLELQGVLRSIGLDVNEVRVSVGSHGSWTEEGKGFAEEKRSSHGREATGGMEAAVDEEQDSNKEALNATDHWVA